MVQGFWWHHGSDLQCVGRFFVLFSAFLSFAPIGLLFVLSDYFCFYSVFYDMDDIPMGQWSWALFLLFTISNNRNCLLGRCYIAMNCFDINNVTIRFLLLLLPLGNDDFFQYEGSHRC